MFKKIIFFFFTFISAFSFSQKSDSSFYVFKQAERELKELQKQTFFSRNEKERIEGNKKFLSVWSKIIRDPEILNYPFDSLKEISILTPKDKKFKLITWNLFKEDGTHAFFGLLLVNNSKRVKTGFLKHETTQSYEYFTLVDRSASIKSPESYIGSPDKWFGMLYTQLIENDGYYTLVGWDGNDKLTQRKFVDVLYFKANGDAVFGKDVFKFPRKNPKRLMFEYSTDVTMSLKYDDKRKQIVYSHLGSKQEGSVLDGQFQYYGPDGSFDALEQKKGKWITIEDIDARNEQGELSKKNKPNPKKQTPVYKPK